MHCFIMSICNGEWGTWGYLIVAKKIHTVLMSIYDIMFKLYLHIQCVVQQCMIGYAKELINVNIKQIATQ